MVSIKHLSRNKTIYKHVQEYVYKDHSKFLAKLDSTMTRTGLSWSKQYDTLKEAAIAVDRKLLECGRMPVNVLISKTAI